MFDLFPKLRHNNVNPFKSSVSCALLTTQSYRNEQKYNFGDRAKIFNVPSLFRLICGKFEVVTYQMQKHCEKVWTRRMYSYVQDFIISWHIWYHFEAPSLALLTVILVCSCWLKLLEFSAMRGESDGSEPTTRIPIKGSCRLISVMQRPSRWTAYHHGEHGLPRWTTFGWSYVVTIYDWISGITNWQYLGYITAAMVRNFLHVIDSDGDNDCSGESGHSQQSRETSL